MCCALRVYFSCLLKYKRAVSFMKFETVTGNDSYLNLLSICSVCLQEHLLYMHFSSLLKVKPAVSCPLQFLVNIVHKLFISFFRKGFALHGICHLGISPSPSCRNVAWSCLAQSEHNSVSAVLIPSSFMYSLTFSFICLGPSLICTICD